MVSETGVHFTVTVAGLCRTIRLLLNREGPEKLLRTSAGARTWYVLRATFLRHSAMPDRYCVLTGKCRLRGVGRRYALEPCGRRSDATGSDGDIRGSSHRQAPNLNGAAVFRSRRREETNRSSDVTLDRPQAVYEAVFVTVVPLHDNDLLHLYNKSIAERLLYTPTLMVARSSLAAPLMLIYGDTVERPDVLGEW